VKALLDVGIIFTVTGVVATVWGLVGLGGNLPLWATRHHPPVRVGLIVGVVLLVVGVPLLVVALA
jgi:hypothetical protein